MDEMQLYNTYIHKIKTGLQEICLPEEPHNLYEPIHYMLSMKGKHVRPLLTFLAAELFGKEELDDVLPASLAIECFHNFTLIHDDIMDNASLRRGKLPVYKKWNTNIAILSGDVLMVKAYEQLSKCAPAYIPSLLRVFNKIAIEVCEGQQWDMDFEKERSISEESYLQMIRLKTSVLLGGALQMGAILANATDKDVLRINGFGINLGLAFQLQDDILDTYGEKTVLGKRIGGDIVENKKTILLVKLLECISQPDSQKLEYFMTKERDEENKIQQVKNLFAKYNIYEKAVSLKNRFTEIALTELDEIRVPETRKQPLKQIVNNLLNRKS
ncbi:MAG TPA: polyprenyl synthetase family protein [Sphingobacterium sp.]|nr:polyprenyl synthetase family protein [Sphingobacterium sp.]